MPTTERNKGSAPSQPADMQSSSSETPTRPSIPQTVREVASLAGKEISTNRSLMMLSKDGKERHLFLNVPDLKAASHAGVTVATDAEVAALGWEWAKSQVSEGLSSRTPHGTQSLEGTVEGKVNRVTSFYPVACTVDQDFASVHHYPTKETRTVFHEAAVLVKLQLQDLVARAFAATATAADTTSH